METAGSSKGKIVTGWILSILASLMMLMGVVMSFTNNPQAVEGTVKYGYSAASLPYFGALELVITLLYLVPQTAVLGALLLTAYFGGAVATHVRLHDGMLMMPIIVCVVFWLGLYLREPRLADLLPIRRSTR